MQKFSNRKLLVIIMRTIKLKAEAERQSLDILVKEFFRIIGSINVVKCFNFHIGVHNVKKEEIIIQLIL